MVVSASEFSVGGRAVDQYPLHLIVKCVWGLSGLTYLLYSFLLSQMVFYILSALLCALKGSSFLYSLPVLSNSPVHVRKKKIRVLSLNVYMRPMGVSDVNGDYKWERLTDFITHKLHEFDVICLQECFSTLNSRRNSLVKAAHRVGYSYAVASPPPDMFSFKCFDAGLLILSRFPIEETHFEEFTDSCHADSLSNKGILWAKIRMGPLVDDIFHIFNTHLQVTLLLCT
jgi:hypothetical protein